MVWVGSENEAIFAQMRHEKRSLAELNEHFRNEIWAKMGRLQPDPKPSNKLFKSINNETISHNALVPLVACYAIRSIFFYNSSGIPFRLIRLKPIT